ncbi:protein C2-DOMAIN ABA-RELATED 7 [Sesamum alatum]|uniref:Protein C2-DOMAIN ABA-RELATED 7 n=1 Tax=Sesamum alatum TaxID=300844 RepID=A0AAE1YH83_9LAMI|nr:protein C2-DOMAIN ABA-RELATED 7 [Sesamum alatum]
MDVLGLVKIRIRRGIGLAVRDTVSSDPYCVVSCGTQKVKTKVVKGNCNPVWNEELTIYVKDLSVPIILQVFDKDTFTDDDNMGSAVIDIKPLIECVRMELEGLPDGTRVDRIMPNRDNCLADESPVIWNQGKMTQDMTLRLNNVECGEVEVQVEWLEDEEGFEEAMAMDMKIEAKDHAKWKALFKKKTWHDRFVNRIRHGHS